jgi:hypothetical protein
VSGELVSQIMYCLNDDPTLIMQFMREDTLKLYMPYTSYDDRLILRFFHPDEQGNEALC